MKPKYLDTVEQYFRLAIREDDSTTPPGLCVWRDMARAWIAAQKSSTRHFLNIVFDTRYATTSDGLYSYRDSKGANMGQKSKRLIQIEKHFAHDTGIAAGQA